jgi:hypothetical protein
VQPEHDEQARHDAASRRGRHDVYPVSNWPACRISPASNGGETSKINRSTPTRSSICRPRESGLSQMPLVRLKPGDEHDDRNLKVSSGSFMPFGGTHSVGVRSEDTVDVGWEKDPRGSYRITPRQPLPPGEYGFILTQGLSARAAGKVYDFGVD